MRLYNITNHPSYKWGVEQKKGWDEIVDIPFPNIPPEWGAFESFGDSVGDDVISEVSWLFSEKNFPGINGKEKFNILLQGEFSFCYLAKQFVEENFPQQFTFFIPTTKREVVEKDGQKISKFVFVKWRCLT